MKARLVLITCMMVVVSLFTPIRAFACSGWVDCWFGFSERSEIKAQRDVRQTELNAQRDVEISRIQQEAEQRMAEANAEVERIKNARYADEQQAKIAIANAQAQRDAFIAQTTALATRQIAEIEATHQLAATGLQEQTKIAVAGITQTGLTERTRINGRSTLWIVGIIIIGAIVVLSMRRQPAPRVIIVPQRLLNGSPNGRRLPHPNSYELPFTQYQIEEIINHEQQQ